MGGGLMEGSVVGIHDVFLQFFKKNSRKLIPAKINSRENYCRRKLIHLRYAKKKSSLTGNWKVVLLDLQDLYDV